MLEPGRERWTRSFTRLRTRGPELGPACSPDDLGGLEVVGHQGGTAVVLGTILGLLDLLSNDVIEGVVKLGAYPEVTSELFDLGLVHCSHGLTVGPNTLIR